MGGVVAHSSLSGVVKSLAEVPSAEQRVESTRICDEPFKPRNLHEAS